MKATEAKLLDFLKKSPQFVIPIYQRTYSWTEKECKQLWEDIIRTGGKEEVNAHFVGSIVYIEKGLYHVTSQAPMLVIDGQQRLTTLTLLLAALAEELEKQPEGHQEVMEGFSPRKIKNYFLVNPEEDGEKHYKLILSQTDRDSLISIVSGKSMPKECSVRVKGNYDLFREWITAHKNELATVCKGLAKLVIVDISLSREQDNPQLIFESMNSTGRELSQADLIRNFILMGLEPNLQTKLYQDYWRPMEIDFGQEAYVNHFDSFMRHYLTVKTGEIPNLKDVYDAFKAHFRQAFSNGVEHLVAEIHDFSGYFCAMALGHETDPELALAFQDLRELRVDVAYPFLLELYHDYKSGVLSREDFLAAVRMIEAYVFRRAICSIPTNSLNKTFSNFSKSLKKDRYLESIQAYFINSPSYRRFPSDEEFKRDLQTRDLYNFRSRSYWLRRLENFGRKERAQVAEYTIEHIMPKSDDDPAKVTKEWKQELGPEWERVWQELRHTLGNLTLTGYNSEYSNQIFKKKRDMKGGFKESPLRLNQGLGLLEHWNELTIRERAENLTQIALKVWPAPALPADVLAAYKHDVPSTTTYTLNDHPHLANGIIREVFEAFRKEVLALDPCVTEEILKLYIAYKAETNFVDVVPQAKRLRLSLNMSFPDIDDPRGICKDVKGLGRWGNGDVEVGLSSLDEIQYVVGLVRQSLEKQMGSGAISEG